MKHDIEATLISTDVSSFSKLSKHQYTPSRVDTDARSSRRLTVALAAAAAAAGGDHGVGAGDHVAAAAAADEEAPPQDYDGDAVAATVFAHEYFYMTPLDSTNHQGARAAKLGGLSVREVLEKLYHSAAATQSLLQVPPPWRRSRLRSGP